MRDGMNDWENSFRSRNRSSDCCQDVRTESRSEFENVMVDIMYVTAKTALVIFVWSLIVQFVRDLMGQQSRWDVVKDEFRSYRLQNVCSCPQTNYGNRISDVVFSLRKENDIYIYIPPHFLSLIIQRIERDRLCVWYMFCSADGGRDRLYVFSDVDFTSQTSSKFSYFLFSIIRIDDTFRGFRLWRGNVYVVYLSNSTKRATSS